MSNEVFDFKAFTPFIEDSLITDINYNGRELWLDHLEKGRYAEENFFLDESIEGFCYRYANYANMQFNPNHPIMENETSELRLSILHSSIAKSGYSISIRKTPAYVRLKENVMLKTSYATKEVLDLLELFVINHCSIFISGACGAGKTELAKFLTTFIPSLERVITIEDTLEIRYDTIHPYKDNVTLKVNDNFTYVDAIKASLRQRPNWLLVSEIRSREVVQMLEAVSTGSKIITTLHAKDAASIPMRLLHMFPGVELSNNMILHNIYENIDIGIHIEAIILNDGIKRYIKEIVYYDIDKDSNIIQNTLYHCINKTVISELPKSLKDKIGVGHENEVKRKKVKATTKKLSRKI